MGKDQKQDSLHEKHLRNKLMLPILYRTSPGVTTSIEIVSSVFRSGSGNIRPGTGNGKPGENPRNGRNGRERTGHPVP